MKDKKYNYHSHTYRCGHAAEVPDNVYLNTAIENGFDKYGITDHVPVHPIFYSDDTVRMHDIEKEEYLESMRSLKQQYSTFLDLYYGFEAEYDEIIEEYLCELRDKSDYMIMGQHYVLNKNIRSTPMYPFEYARKVCQGIKSGIFDIVAHPDIFMQYRTSMITPEEKAMFERNALLAAEMICTTAKEYGVPLELNLGATYPFKLKRYDSEQTTGYEKEIAEFLSKSLEEEARYPTKLFWEVAMEHENDVVVGIDAHYPDEIAQREEKLEVIGKYIDLSKLRFLPNNYDPVTARKNNVKLQDAYQQTKSRLTCVESRLVGSFVDEYCATEGIVRVDRNKLKSAIIYALRAEPSRKFKVPLATDEITFNRREDLVDIVKVSFRGMSRKDKLSFRDIKEKLMRDIDFAYSFDKDVIDIPNFKVLDRGDKSGKR